MSHIECDDKIIMICGRKFCVESASAATLTAVETASNYRYDVAISGDLQHDNRYIAKLVAFFAVASTN